MFKVIKSAILSLIFLGVTQGFSLATPLNLQQALSRVDHSPSIQRSNAQMEEAAAVSSRALSKFIPHFSVVGSRELLLSRNQGYLLGELEIFDGGKAINQTRIDNSNEQVSRLEYLATLKSQKIKVIESYFQAVYDRDRLRYLQKTLTEIIQIKSKLALLVKNRAAASRQLRRIIQEVIVLEQRVRDANLAQAESLNALKQLIGIGVDEEVTLDKAPDFKIDANWELSAKVIKGDALKNSESLAVYSEKVDQYSAKKWLAYAEFMPSVSLRAQYGYPGYYHAANANTTLALQVEIPLPIELSLLRRPINQIIAQQKKQTEVSSEELRQAISGEVDLRFRRVLQVNQQLENTKTLLNLTEEDRIDEQKMFISGLQDGASLVMYLQQEQTIRLSIQNYIRIKDTDYSVINVLTSAEEK